MQKNRDSSYIISITRCAAASKSGRVTAVAAFSLILFFMSLALLVYSAYAAEPTADNQEVKAESERPVASAFQQAETLMKRGTRANDLLALNFVDEGLKIDPWYFPLWKMKATLQARLEAYPEAEQAVGVYLGRYPHDVEALMTQLEVLLKKNPADVQATREGLEGFLVRIEKKDFLNVLSAFLMRPASQAKDISLFLDAWDGSSEEGVHELLTALYVNAELKTATGLFASLIGKKRLPGSPLEGTLYFVMGKALGDTEVTMSIEYLYKAAELGVSPVDVAYEVGQIQFKNKRYHQAAEAWERHWRRAALPARWVSMIADARFKAEEPEEAEKILDTGLKAIPHDPALQGKYMLALKILKRDNDLDMYERRLDGMNSFVGLAYGRALVAEHEGNMVLAREELKKAIQYGGAASGIALGAQELERWMGEVGDMMASSVADRRALELRDLGWNYWQEKEYRMSYETWEEALNIGFPQARPFILNITMRFIEVGMMKEAASIIHRHLPQITFFGFAQMLAAREKWYLMPSVMRAITKPSSGEAPWIAAYELYGNIRMGTSRIPAIMDRFAKIGAPKGSYSFTGVDDMGDFFTRTLSITDYRRFMLRIGSQIVKQRNITLFTSFMNTPQWKILQLKEKTSLIAGATREAVLQRDLGFIMNLFKSPHWTLLSESNRERLMAFIGRMIVDQQRTDHYQTLFGSREWARLPVATRAELLSDIGRILFQQGDTAQAVGYLKQSLELDPNQSNANMIMAVYERSINNEEESKAYLARGVKTAKPELKAYVMAELAMLENDRDAAVAHYAEYLNFVPGTHWVRLYIIETLAGIHRYEEARREMSVFEKYLADGDKGVRSYLAQAKLILGDPGGAEELFLTLVLESPDNNSVARSWADALAACGQHERVVEVLSKRCVETGDNRMAAQLAESCIALMRHQEALDWAQFGLEKTPDDRRLIRIAADTAYGLNQMKLSEKYSARLVEMDNHSIRANSLLAEALKAQESWEALHSHDINVLATNPVQLRMLMNESDIAKISSDRKSLVKAKKLDQKILKHYDNDPANITRAAISAASAKDFRLAIPKLEKLVELGPNQSVTALMFTSVSDIVSVEGMPLNEFEKYLEMVRTNGARFASLEDFHAVPEKGRQQEDPTLIPTLVIIGRSSAETLSKINELLDKYSARACLVIGEESLVPETPYYADCSYLNYLASTGRWEFLLSDYSNRLIPRDGEGTMVSFWGQPMWLGDRLETEEEMFFRWDNAMARLLSMAKYRNIKVDGWVYPIGDYGQFSTEADDAIRTAYRRAVEERFMIAFAPASRGASVPHQDIWRVPMRAIYTGTSLEMVSYDMVYQHPTRAGVKELAKVISWNGQLPRADRLFHRAEELGVASEDLYYFHARNALYEGDVPTSLELARKAEEIAPDSERVKQLMSDAEYQLRHSISLVPLSENDSDGRNYDELRLFYSKYVTERLMLFGDVGYGRWKDNGGSLGGTLFNIGARYHTKPEHWVDAEIGYTFYDNEADGGAPAFRLGYHGAFSTETMHMNGTYDLTYTHGGVDTREAIIEGIHSDRFEALTNFRFNNWWDVNLYAYFTARTDGNNTWGVSFRPMYRLVEYPLLSVGYWGQIADSDRNPPEYWAPVDYQSHMLVVTARHSFSSRLSIGGLLGYGTATSDGSGWEYIWRGNFDITWRFLEDWLLSFNYNHYETPTYRLDRYRLGITYRF